MNVEIDFQLLVSDGSSTSFITNGKYHIQEEFKTLTFIEQTDLKSLTKIYIYTDKVVIKRTGKIQMDMSFSLKETTMVNLKTDFAYELQMNNYTKYLQITPDQIQAIYQTETDKEQNITHNLMIKWKNVNQ